MDNELFEQHNTQNVFVNMTTLIRSIIKRACEKLASRHKFLHIDVKSRYISAIFFIDETKRTRGEGFELKCSKTMCTLFKLYNVIITTHFVTVIACARQQIISARSGDTNRQTHKKFLQDLNVGPH